VPKPPWRTIVQSIEILAPRSPGDHLC
jgi:hypothetical protein